MKLRTKVSWLTNRLQQYLFPDFEECYEIKLTKEEKRLVMILEILEIEQHVPKSSNKQWMGRKLKEREAIARGFVVKQVLNYPYTKTLVEELGRSRSLRKICGFASVSDVPSESTFSRAFGEFSKSDLGEKVHKVLVETYAKPELTGHISRDSTAIEGREKPLKKKKKIRKAQKRGRPSKGEKREKTETRIERQMRQTSEESLKEIPVQCDVGTKKNSKGHKESWIGYKLHADVNDCGLPINIELTSASVHDSQVAIPMMQTTSSRIDYLYDVMDAAYDASQILEMSKKLGHVPLVDKNRRGGESVPMMPHESLRYNERSVVERFNSRLKESFGAKNVMVKGAMKVKQHLMFGVIALFADQLLKLVY